jgi:tetratricopeptide (TPR) repeat protein
LTLKNKISIFPAHFSISKLTAMDNILSDKQPLRILFLASDPSNAARLHLGKELQEVRNKLAGNQYFEIKDHQAVKPDDVIQTIISYKPHIVHFSGHGQDSGELCFEDEQGKSKAIPPDALASLFSLVTEYIKCVVVNTCYAEKQANAIAQYVPVVIGTKKEITDNAAIKFSTGFYTALDPDLSQVSLEKAYKQGRIAIQFDDNLQGHATPILIFGSPEVRFSAEVDTAFSSISMPKGLAVQTLIRGFSLTGKKMGLTDAVIQGIINEKIERLENYNQGVIEYENSLNDILRDEFPLSDFSNTALLQLQNGLGLSNEVVLKIKEKVLSNPKLDSSYSWYDRGRGQYDLGNFEKAIEYYSKAVGKKPDYSGAYFEKAYNNYKIQRYENAIEDFTKAIEFNKNWEVGSDLNSAYFERGRSYYALQPQSDETMGQALKDWSKFIEQNPNDYNAFWNRGLANQYFRNFDKAIADFKKSFEMDKSSSNKDKSFKATTIVKCYSELGNQEDIDKWTKIGLELQGKNVAPLNVEDN